MERGEARSSARVMARACLFVSFGAAACVGWIEDRVGGGPGADTGGRDPLSGEPRPRSAGPTSPGSTPAGSTIPGSTSPPSGASGEFRLSSVNTAIRRLSNEELLNVLEDKWRARSHFDASLLAVEGGSASGFDNNHEILTVDRDWLSGYFRFVESGSLRFAEQVLLPRMKGCETGSGAGAIATCKNAVLADMAALAFTALNAEGLQRFFDAFLAKFKDFNPSLAQDLQFFVEAVLKSPDFLFLELGGDDSPVTLAERLASFLWRSSPDRILLDLARSGQLEERKNLHRELDRLMADPKHLRLLAGFFKKWFHYDDVLGFQVDEKYFDLLSDSVKQAMVRESELLFRDVLVNEAPIMDIVGTRQTYLTEPLSIHYGITAPKGSTPMKVSTQGTERRGFLTHASFLAATSNPTFSSPVNRGLYILEKILCSAPPPPPPDAKDAKDAKDAAMEPEQTKGLSVKQLIQLHSSSPSCAGCHRELDPLGIGLEHFNPTGKFRTRYEVQDMPVDASATWNGRVFQDHRQMIDYLASDERVVSCMLEALASFALNRDLKEDDLQSIKGYTQGRKYAEIRFRDLIHDIVVQPAFLNR
jgi:hypothetical protein